MDRTSNLDQLSEPFDVAIIGGGATGLGAAVEAASRGYRTVLLEARDFAHGTSSRSTKLVHGGVRYLAQGNVGLVREALLERGRLRRNAPHLVGDLEFVVPAYAWWSGPYYGVGLKLYDVLAGRHRLGKSQLLSRAQVLERIPTLEPDQLKGGIRYFDGQFDDARLAVTLALTADDLGAVLVNHASVIDLVKTGGRVRGVRVHDAESGREHEVQAGVVINATGVFADTVRRMDDPDAAALVTPSQGVHLVLSDAFLPSTHALMIPRTDDGRVLFVIPWHKRALVGTTDTPVPEVSVEPRALEEEVEFLLDHAARYLTRDPTPEDVLSVYVGLRPLVRAEGTSRTASLRRDHSIFESESGLVTIVGGKWTTYRRMGEDVVDHAARIAGLPERPSVTGGLKLHGAPLEDHVDHTALGTPSEMLAAYGTDADLVRDLAEQDPELAVPMHPRLPYLLCEVAWAVRQEMARSLEDVLSRRTRALVLDARAALECAPVVARVIARELGRDEAWVKEEVSAFEKRARESLLA
ncbi:MAG TPA: glycerol-3-phosphate dehydrogenase/oxidase [Myxococcaceae bacterium]|jgi:glycerol-3-phosphate dehydrogenase|nr:glycerol-3-phosphate dehydrogenase/oxidase [Myxococcaceae bacterium]